MNNVRKYEEYYYSKIKSFMKSGQFDGFDRKFVAMDDDAKTYGVCFDAVVLNPKNVLFLPGCFYADENLWIQASINDKSIVEFIPNNKIADVCLPIMLLDMGTIATEVLTVARTDRRKKAEFLVSKKLHEKYVDATKGEEIRYLNGLLESNDKRFVDLACGLAEGFEKGVYVFGTSAKTGEAAEK